MTTMFQYLRRRAAQFQSMLVLSRRRDEVVRLEIPPSEAAREFFVTVVRADPSKIRLGFSGPREIQVVRDELPRRSEVMERPPVAEAVAA